MKNWKFVLPTALSSGGVIDVSEVMNHVLLLELNLKVVGFAVLQLSKDLTSVCTFQ